MSRIFIREFFLFDPSDHFHLGSSQNEVGHQEVKEVVPGPPEQAFQNGSRGADIFLGPEVSLLQFPDSHLIGSEDRVTHVIMGPVPVKDSPLLLQPLLKGGSRKGSEN
jgi:hypothetical protein